MRALVICAVVSLAVACSGTDAPTAGSVSIDATPSTTVTTPAPSVTTPTTEPTTSSSTTSSTASSTTSAPSITSPATTSPANVPATEPPTTVHPEVLVRSAEPLTRELADDLMAGRDNGTIGSALAREVIADELATFAAPLPGFDTFEHPFVIGTNLVAVVPGTDLADEYVVIGAHYDHLGENCRFPTTDDVVCNGAADNAAGVAIAVEAVRAVADTDPRRSVVIALWDAEEDGLVGSSSFVAEPPLPLGRVVAYVNLDLLGVSLLPSLSGHTVVIGAESGGDAFRNHVSTSVADAGLTPITLSVAFGQGRSDHAPFADAGVPVVFFSDSTNGCYHTVEDEIERLEVDKLDRQLRAVTDVLVGLSTAEVTPTPTDAPFVSFDDVVALHEMVRAGQPDLGLLGDAAPDAEAFLGALERLVDDGPDAFDDADVNVVVGAAGLLVEALATQDCPT